MAAFRVIGIALACWVMAYGQDGTEWAKRLKETKFTLKEAMDKGLKEAKEGVVFHAELEEDKGHLVYSIDIAQGTKTCNVVMDVKDGKVLENDTEEEDHSAELKECKITLAAAIDTALKKSPGQAIEAQLTPESGKPVFTVSVYGDGKVNVLKVDGKTGEVMGGGASKPQEEAKFTETFKVDASEWSSTGSNPYWSLEPGSYLILEGKDKDATVKLTITVLDETKKVDGVETRIVEEREEEDGKLIEVSRNYFAISKRTNCVYYFGEDVNIYKDGKIVSHDGAWLSGEKGARFGMMMPGAPLLGARHYQEIAPGVAMDRAEIVGLNEKMETAAGKFENVLKVEETTPLEKGKGYKYYAYGVGLIKDGGAKLTKYGRHKK